MAAFIRNREARDAEQVSASAILSRPHSRIGLSHFSASRSPLIVRGDPNLVQGCKRSLPFRWYVQRSGSKAAKGALTSASLNWLFQTLQALFKSL
jgi:hypothetical protein